MLHDKTLKTHNKFTVHTYLDEKLPEEEELFTAVRTI